VGGGGLSDKQYIFTLAEKGQGHELRALSLLNGHAP